MKVLQNNAKIAEIQARLNKYPYLSKSSLPGYADAKIFGILETIKRYPDRKSNSNFYHWYIIMKQFSAVSTAKWITDELYFDNDDNLIIQFIRLYKKQGSESPEIPNESRVNKIEVSNQFEYTIDMYINNWIQQKMRQLTKILEVYGAEKSQIEENEKSKLIRIVCRMDTKKSESMINQISACIQYYNIQIKKKPIKMTSNNLIQDKSHQNN